MRVNVTLNAWKMRYTNYKTHRNSLSHAARVLISYDLSILRFSYKGNVKMNFFISLFTENKLLHSFNVCGARFQTLAASILNVASSIAELLDSTKVVTFIDLVVLASSAGMPLGMWVQDLLCVKICLLQFNKI